MSRHRLAIVIIAGLTLSGCGQDDMAVDPPPRPSSARVAPVPADTTSAPAATVAVPADPPEITTNPDGTVNSAGPRPATNDDTLTPGGLGPYRIGVALRDLTAGGLVTGSKPAACPDHTVARGAGRYRSPDLLFFQGRLMRLTTTDPSAATDRDVRIGSALAEARAAYPQGTQVDDWNGRAAWLATAGDYGLLFETRDGKVSEIQAGIAGPMRFKYTDDQGC